MENWLDAELQSLACAGLLNEFLRLLMNTISLSP